MINFSRGILVEYALSLPLLMVEFEFNPQSISYTRSVNIPDAKPNTNRLGFTTPQEAPRVTQGVTPQKENIDIKILLDATDRMDD
ncbi:MAG: hypothetical protein JKY13_00305, partial [Gammaproteobacteria bacterium]|nr:hypothetical protein [Gammaproteobacteria bacterium]